MRVAIVGVAHNLSEKNEILLQRIGQFCAFKGWNVVSGNATGADYAGASGANKINPAAVILYLPWKTYNKEQFVEGNQIHVKLEPEWSVIAKRHHPKYDVLTQGVKKFMDRNAAIMLNSDIVVAAPNWQKIGGGGTGHGLRIATELNHPIFDVTRFGEEALDEVLWWLEIQESKLVKTS